MKRPWKRRKKVLTARRPETLGAAPGSVIIDPQAPPTSVYLTKFDEQAVQERELFDLSSLKSEREQPGVLWLNVVGLGSAAIIKQLGELFHLHPLAMEDVVNVHQRPKVDRYGEHLFIVLRMDARCEKQRTEQVSMFLGRGYVITFLEDPGDCFDPVRKRLRATDGVIRRRGADYLTYALLDAAVDAYFPMLEDFGEKLEELEDEVLLKPSPAVVTRIHDAKHTLRTLRRVIWPLRDAMNELARDPSPLIADDTRVYFRDLYDHTVQIIDIVETYREIGSDLVDLYLSSLSNRMNEIMRVLTVISTIFMPLSFIVGLYGMNFNTTSPWNMPELNWRYGYPLVLATLVVVTLGLLYFFHRRGWLGRQWGPEHYPATGDATVEPSYDRPASRF
ncbi:MAG: magnesium/cobalt transporter CorA [Planctomycetaceae bacterium]|nr:magnesium/cobalt transporter CorA [Planctomycetaceae bacterium]